MYSVDILMNINEFLQTTFGKKGQKRVLIIFKVPDRMILGVSKSF